MNPATLNHRHLNVCDPFHLKEALWPDVKFFDKQRQIIQSVEKNSETVVVAGNQLGV